MALNSDIDLNKKLNLFEIQCITGNFKRNDVFLDPELYRNSNDYELIKDLDGIMKNIANHDYPKVLETEYKCLEPFKEVCKDFTLVFYEMCSQMKSNYQYLFHPNGENCPYVKQLILLFVGVAALQEFVRVNFSGPLDPLQTVYRVCAEFLPDSHFSNDSVLDALARDGEVILAKLSHPKLLYLSLMLLFGNSFNKCLTHKWWLLRCLMIHQKLLPETIIALHKSITSLINKQARMDFLVNKESMLAEVMFYVECAQVHLYYSEINIAKKYLISAQNVLGIGIKFNVAFNKKTIPQESFVTVKRNDSRYKSEFLIETFSPIRIQFDIDRKDFDFIDADRNNLVDLLPEEQMVLLTYCDLFQCSEGCQLSEEDIIILKALLSQPKVWVFQIKALFHFCKKRKSADLNFTSLQITEFFKLKVCEIPPYSLRQNFIFCALPPLNYELYELLSDIIVDPEESLSVCEQQHIWSEADAFYNTDAYRERGIKTLNEQIAIKPSSILWCYLGNIHNKAEMYQVAWDLSRQTNARSQRCLGNHYEAEKIYDKCIDHYKQSLLANPLQPAVMQVIGINAMSFGNFDLAIEVFRRILEMDDCNFSVWNNLTYSYIKCGKNIDACQCFLQVQSNENGDNYLLLCSKIGAFKEVIRFYESKIKSVPNGLNFNSIDFEILQTLVSAVLGNFPGSSDLSYSVLKKKIDDLFKHATDVMSINRETDVKIWDLYCFFLNNTNDLQCKVKSLKTMISLQYKIINCTLKRMDLKKENFDSFLQRVKRYIKMVKFYIRISNLKEALFPLIHKTKALLDRFLHTAQNGHYYLEISRNKTEFRYIVDQVDFFEQSRVADNFHTMKLLIGQISNAPYRSYCLNL